jgi:hypothetical protein
VLPKNSFYDTAYLPQKVAPNPQHGISPPKSNA